METSPRINRIIATITALAVLAIALPIHSAYADSAEATEHHFDIRAQPLPSALIAFGQQAGLQFSIDSGLTAGKNSLELKGAYRTDDALRILLSGSGLVWHYTANNTVLIEQPATGVRALGAVRIEGAQVGPFTPLDGFGAGAGSNGSSDPTATEGTRSFTTNGQTVASRSPLALKDTAQSVSVTTSELIEQQNLTGVMDALERMPGVTIYGGPGSTDGIVVRGFSLHTLTIDGGAPLGFGSTYFTPSQNLTEYDNVQLIRGSDSLYGGNGTPGGVLGLTRKRPLDHVQFLADVDLGSWSDHLVRADITGPLGFDGRVRGRLAASDQERNFFYNYATQRDSALYGVLEADLSPATLLRVGASTNATNTRGANDNGLPRYADGTDIGLPRSTNFAPSWAYFNINNTEFFLTLEQQLSSNWRVKFNETRLRQSAASAVPSINGLIDQNNPSQDTYGFGSTSLSLVDTDINLTDLTVSGGFQWFGYRQSLDVGVNYSRANGGNRGTYVGPVAVVPIDVFAFDPAVFGPAPAPISDTWSGLYRRQSELSETVSLRLQFAARLHATAGVKLAGYHWLLLSGDNSTPWTPFIEQKTKQTPVPYAAMNFDLTKNTSLYTSYADLYESNGDALAPGFVPIPPTRGQTYEIGIKSSLKDGRLNASIGAYYTARKGMPVYLSDVPPTNPLQTCCYLPIGAEIVRGVDAELTGELLPNWQVQLAYNFALTHTNAEQLNNNGLEPTFTQQPKSQIKLWTSYDLPGTLNAWSIGGGLRYDSTRFTDGTACSGYVAAGDCAGTQVPFHFSQRPYVVVDLRAAYRFSTHYDVALNLTNVGNKTYYATAASSAGGNQYGQPFAYKLAFHAKF